MVNVGKLITFGNLLVREIVGQTGFFSLGEATSLGEEIL